MTTAARLGIEEKQLELTKFLMAEDPLAMVIRAQIRIEEELVAFCIRPQRRRTGGGREQYRGPRALNVGHAAARLRRLGLRGLSSIRARLGSKRAFVNLPTRRIAIYRSLSGAPKA
jgi:hypothetical protein